MAVDGRRIYVTGHSDGAGMAFRVGVELADLVAAIAPVEGYLWFTPAQLTRPVSLLLVAGAEDPINPVGGGTPKVKAGRGESIKLPSMRDNFATWTRLLNCRDITRSPSRAGGVEMEKSDRCDGGARARLVVIGGQGHSWPGGYEILPAFVVGPSSKAYNATDAIWEFFRDQRLPQ